MDREKALVELRCRLTNPEYIRHSFGVEAIMRELGAYFKEDVDLWGLAGLLHDIDLEKTQNDLSKHSLVGAEILENLELDDSVIYAVKAHNGVHKIKRKRKMDKALYAAAAVSSLIMDSVLVCPSKKLVDVTVILIMSHFNEKGFAKGVDREQIRECEEIGFTMEEFISISLKALQKIASELEM